MEFGGEPFLLQGPQTYCFPSADLTWTVGAPEQRTCVRSGLWSELFGHEGCKSGEDEAKNTMQLHHGFSVGAATSATVASVGAVVGVGGGATTVGAATCASVAGPITELQGM